MEDLIIKKQKRDLFLGLQEGCETIDVVWRDCLDSSLQLTIYWANIINVYNKKTEEETNFLVLKDGETINMGIRLNILALYDALYYRNIIYSDLTLEDLKKSLENLKKSNTHS